MTSTRCCLRSPVGRTSRSPVTFWCSPTAAPTASRALLDPGPGRLQTPAGSSFTYTYDFGDNWRHKVTVEKVTPADPSVTYPVCTGGRRARPPEDCGGVWRYVNVLAVLADPADEEHASRREWVGGAFDPEAFDPSEFADNLKVGSALEP